jgi:predicted ArsR family transcriptional regulator
MPAGNLDRRFQETTRGQVLGLLRRGPHTVEEMARALGLTDNAIRLHLASLERDGLIRQSGVRRGPGVGKPATIYDIDPEAEPLLSRAYAPVLGAVLDELVEQLPAERSEEVMEGAGRRLAAVVGRAPSGDLATRVGAAAALLTSLGGMAEVERKEGALVIRGCGGCPLSAATGKHPKLCRAVEALLTEYIGAPVRECCDREGRPRCHFEVPDVPAAA